MAKSSKRGIPAALLLVGVAGTAGLVGYLLYLTAEPPVPMVIAVMPEGGIAVIPTSSLPQAPPWTAAPNPRTTADFPAAGIIKLERTELEVQRSPLSGEHVVVRAPAGATQRILDLRTGTSLGEVPATFTRLAVSDDGRRLAAVVRGAGAAGELRFLERDGLKRIRGLPLPVGFTWCDFGTTADLAFVGTVTPQLRSILLVDLKDLNAEPKPLAVTVPIGAGEVAVSPNRTLLAVPCGRHVELFRLRDGAPAGRIAAAGEVLRSTFTPDGAELLVLSFTPTGASAADDKQANAVQWTAYSLSDGKLVRQGKSTGDYSTPVGRWHVGTDDGVALFGGKKSLKVVDLALAAPILQVDRTLLGGRSRTEFIVHHPEGGCLELYRPDAVALEAGAAEVRSILAPRPAATPTDRTGEVVPTATATGWAVPIEPEVKRTNIPFELTTENDWDCEFLPTRADAKTWSTLQVRRILEPRLHYALTWAKIDPSTGELLPAVTLWPSAMEPGRAIRDFGFASMVVDQSQAGDTIALRDPRDFSRIDLWDDRGRRLVGFQPDERKADVAWLAFGAGHRLFTLCERTLTCWDGPKAKALFRCSTPYTSVFLSPRRGWLAAVGERGIDFLDATTGATLGRLPMRDLEGDWPGMGVSPDGKRYYAARARNGESTVMHFAFTVATQYEAWDLTTGKPLHSGTVVGTSRVPRGAILHELTPNLLMIGNDLIDLRCRAAVYRPLIDTSLNVFRPHRSAVAFGIRWGRKRRGPAR